MTSITADPPLPPSPPTAPPVERSIRRIKPVELAAWVEMRLPRITQKWLKEVQNRYDPGTRGLNGVLEEFLGLLASFLPGMLGPYREQVEPLWTRTSELFGAVAAKRGLAAGEVIEEVQILREVVIRLLYQDPPLAGRAPVSLREILRLSRAIDMGVTHSSVGHTDALFFSLFEGSGIPEAPPTSELVDELRQELEGIRQELRQILGDVPGTSWAAEEDGEG
ncbi:MAG TPA: hypothetical protein VLH75_15025 [Longimicrobiales bacterium]|nr:hypothetical protein [Longimicrobiales bacterium]